MSKKWIPNFVRRPIVNALNACDRLKSRIYLAARSGKIWFPDKAFQKWDYRIHSGKKLNLRNPKTFCEKLQWMKYYYRNPFYTQLVDKYAVRSYVSETIGEEYLVPLYGVWDHFDDIDFDALPDSFVLKCTHDQGSVILVPDKSKFERTLAKEKLESALKKNHFYLCREWPYKNIPPRIICEGFLKVIGENDLPDYKLMCFDGKVKLLYVCTNRTTDLCYNFYNPEWEFIPVNRADGKSANITIEKPKNLEKMIELAEQLSSGMPHVRVDFYNVNGEIYFGELTFFRSGGRVPFVPEEFELEFGNWITLPQKMR